MKILKEIEKNAEMFFKWKEINRDNFYERINCESYLWKNALLDCIKDINLEMEDIDKGYLYWNTLEDYLTCIVATYLDKYIRENYTKWNCTFTVDE